MVVLVPVQAIEVGAAVDAAPSITNEPFRLRSAASVISGKLLLHRSRTRLPPRCTISR
jgi:hypothetical protein